MINTKLKEYNIKSMMQYHSKVLQEMLQYYEYELHFDIHEITFRKTSQIVLISANVRKWEKKLLNRYGEFGDFLQHRQLFLEAIKSYIIPKLEIYYGTKIKDLFILDPFTSNDQVYIFTVNNFAVSIFKKSDTLNVAVEEKIANKVAGILKNSIGKGPDKVVVSIHHNRYILFSIHGFLSKLHIAFANRSNTDFLAIKDYFKRCIWKIIDDICLEEFECRHSAKHISLDIQKNIIIALVNIKSI